MVASARADEALSFPRLLSGAGELYGRMLRTALAGLVPLAAGGALAAGAFKLAVDGAERSTTETVANREYALAACAAAASVFVAHLVVDAARAQFAADPSRRSGLAAVWRGLRLLGRRPLRTLGLGALGTALAVGSASVLMTIRLQIAQRDWFSMALAWLLAQGAQVAIGFGRAVRIEGLAELSRADAADRLDRASSPPPPEPPRGAEVVHSTTLGALDPPRSGAAR
jgi:hypothetical protein